MNKWIGIGRVVAEPEIAYTQKEVAVCKFKIAVDRKYDRNTTDFLPVVAWRQTGEFIGKYFTKGQKIAIVGSIQTRSYDDKDGNKRYITEIVADEVETCERRKKDETNDNASEKAELFDEYENESDSGLPF
jgi:single-strand DNA-binding protein